MMPPKNCLLDTHIHLFETAHLPTLAWMTPDNPLNSQHSIPEYVAATGTATAPSKPRQTLGFIFVETDRRSSLSRQGWIHALEEFTFVHDVAAGKDPRYRAHSHLVRGIVAWAPVPAGRAAMEKYYEELRKRAGAQEREKVPLLKGFRYLVQWSPRGTMLRENFLDSLRWMREQEPGWVFELTVDCRGVGLCALEEAVEMVRKVSEGGNGVKVVLDHLGKPDLQQTPSSLESSDFFASWKSLLAPLASHDNTFIKFSGCLSELPLSLFSPINIPEIVAYVTPWFSAAIEAFGARRVIWGSDWPVCTINGGEDAWRVWCDVCERVIGTLASEEERERVWWKNAADVYAVQVPEGVARESRL